MVLQYRAMCLSWTVGCRKLFKAKKPFGEFLAKVIGGEVEAERPTKEDLKVTSGSLAGFFKRSLARPLDHFRIFR